MRRRRVGLLTVPMSVVRRQSAMKVTLLVMGLRIVAIYRSALVMTMLQRRRASLPSLAPPGLARLSTLDLPSTSTLVLLASRGRIVLAFTGLKCGRTMAKVATRRHGLQRLA